MDIIMRIIPGIFILIAWIFSFKHIFEWLWSLIQQLTIKAWMLIFWLAFISYVAAHV